MKAIKAILFCALATGATLVAAEVELKIITAKGYVAFAVGDDWPVLDMQTRTPVASAVFQLPNAPDKGTPDSTNLILQLWENGSEKQKTVYEAPVRQYGPVAPVAESFEGWMVFRQEGLQGNTMYSIWDARKSGIADVSVSVRLAWPHLPNNPPGYAEDMERTFRAFLSSVWGGVGEYKPKKVIHAPAKDPERIKSAGGQTIIKEFYDDGTLKTVTRLHPDGRLLGILYHTPKGVPTHFDYYDDKKHIRRTLYYREDGTAKSAKEFDEHGKAVLEQELDSEGNVTKETKPK
jgi:hypothetical protein